MPTITPTKPTHRVFYAWSFTRAGKAKGPYIVIAQTAEEVVEWADAGNGALALETNYDPNSKEQQ